MAMITVKTEEDRRPAAVAYVKRQIEELERNISGCDYVEYVNGRLIFLPGSYQEEKREYEHEKRQWEIMLNLLTDDPPFTLLDW